jgi:lactoylglutathione lyase
MQIERSGIILHAKRYEACVAFYRDSIGLPLEFEKNEPGQVLTILTFGGAYLMIEPGGVARNSAKTDAENPIVIRFNVTDIDAATARLTDNGVAIAVSRFDWGAVGDFHDPDGNRCQLREVASFAT